MAGDTAEGGSGEGHLEAGKVKGDRKGFLLEVFERYHRPEYISPDPLELLYGYEDRFDREIVGLIASSLAYGRVSQIIVSARRVLGLMGPSPRAFLEDSRERDLREMFLDFKHRFTTGREMGDFLVGIRKATRKYGSLGACFLAGLSPGDDTTVPALRAFAREIDPCIDGQCSSLLPDPGRGSACKRLHLFLRWMVRSDEIDPGGWTDVSPAVLVIPLDTHMHRICASLGMSTRKQADEKTAREITEMFRDVDPHDPVRYDFSLTRMGMRGDFASLQAKGQGRM